MNKKNKIIGSLTAASVAIASTITYIVGKKVYKNSVGSKPKISKDEMEKYYGEREDKVLDKLDKYDHEKTFIESSKNGYPIELMNIRSSCKSNDAIVIVHGIRSNYHEVLDVAFEYLEKGYNVVVYNQRQTGSTGGNDYTFGLYEKFDLDEVVKYTKGIYSNGVLGVHGFSMGAATSALHMELNEEDKRVDFYILDAPFHTMKSAINLGVAKNKIPMLPIKYATWAGDIYIKRKDKFSFRDIEPYKAAKNVTVPVMLIHGTDDRTTDPNGSKIIFDTIPHDKKELWLVEGLGHCKANRIIKDEYFERIFKFISEKVENQDKK